VKAEGIPPGMMGRVMFFLLRIAFWLTLVCVLVPGSKSGKPEQQIDAGQAFTVASAAMWDAKGFCERQPHACSAGSQVAAAIGHKAEEGARTLYQLISDKIVDKPEKPAGKTAQKHVDEIADKNAETARTVPASARGTLTQTDLQAAWQSPAPVLPRRDPRTKAGV